ncbi:hypothetical protein NQ315_006823 [Exocentrus adspersus]|uniref:Uncharacterized protein n=1 Tax=Exocentrus adspersus TaxID=1586481 RepID=A0AAV8WBU0_9CUCU|nr:hypothetical protein NQ315_006823 [Exocentrus adspersus]
MSALVVGIAAGAVYIGCVLCCNGIARCRDSHKVVVMFMVYVFMQWRIKNNERYLGYICALKNGGMFLNPHHQDDIYNISGRIQGQEQQRPNHDAFVTIDHITTSNQLNKPNYDDAPPSYEEVMRIAAPQGGSSAEAPTVVVVPRTTD